MQRASDASFDADKQVCHLHGDGPVTLPLSAAAFFTVNESNQALQTLGSEGRMNHMGTASHGSKRGALPVQPWRSAAPRGR